MAQYCRYFIQDRGCRRGNQCTFSHDPKDVPNCRYWQESGTCNRADSCWFPHGDRETYASKLKERHLKHQKNNGKRKHETRRQRQQSASARGRGGVMSSGPCNTCGGNGRRVDEADQLAQLMLLTRSFGGHDFEDDDDDYLSYDDDPLNPYSSMYQDDSDDSDSFPDYSDLPLKDMELYRMKNMFDEMAANASPPDTDSEEEQMMMVYGGGRGGYSSDDDDEEEEEYYGQDDDDSFSGDEGFERMENKKPKGEKGPCAEDGCKRLKNRECENNVCKPCCFLKWPTDCAIHCLSREAKEPLDKYIVKEMNEENLVNELRSDRENSPNANSATCQTHQQPSNRGAATGAGKDVTRQHFYNRPSFDSFMGEDLDREKLEYVKFGQDFDIQDDDILALAQQCPNLQHLYLGDTDTGKGGSITDAAIYYLADKCRKLQTLSLVAATRVSDHSIDYVFSVCSDLRELAVTGHDKSNGKIQGLCLLRLIRNPECAKKLRKIDFDAQSLETVLMLKFRKSRRIVKITNNEVWGDGMADMMVRQQMYGGSGDCCVM